jgi:hypothetical protein
MAAAASGQRQTKLIFRRGLGSGGAINSRIASNTTLNCSS